MAGYFGNSPYDRYVENQLYQYLNEEQEYENLFNELTSELTDDEFDSNEDKIYTLCDYLIKKIGRELTDTDTAKQLLTKIIRNVHNQKNIRSSRIS